MILRSSQALPERGAIEIGRRRSGRPFYLAPDDRKTHVHVIGGSGRGKSVFLEHMIRSDILANPSTKRGLCLLDPHGTLYERVVAWLATRSGSHLGGKIILVEPGAEGWAFGFNPLKQKEQADVAFACETAAEAMAMVWSQNLDETPRLQRQLLNILFALGEHGLPLYDAIFLLRHVDEDNVRAMLVSTLNDPVVAQEWRDLVSLARRPAVFEERVESAHNRFSKFIRSPAIRLCFGQSKQTLDLEAAIEDGHIVLVNLAPQGGTLPEDAARVYGRLIINDLLVKAKNRSRRFGQTDCEPYFYLYIDECYQLLTEDIGSILEQTRKFGLHLTLAHQNLGQLKAQGERIFSAVMSGAQTRIVFGSLSYDDAEILAKDMLHFDMQRTKPKLARPQVVAYTREWFRSVADSDAFGSIDARGYARVRSESAGAGRTSGNSRATSVPLRSMFEYVDPLTGTVTTGDTEAESSHETTSDAEAQSVSHADSQSSTHTEGKSETLVPVMRDISNETYSLEEQTYEGIALLRNQQTRLCLVKSSKMRTAESVETPFVREPPQMPNHVASFREQNFRTSGAALPVAAAEHEIAERHEAITRAAVLMHRPHAQSKKAGPPKRGPDDDEFLV